MRRRHVFEILSGSITLAHQAAVVNDEQQQQTINKLTVNTIIRVKGDSLYMDGVVILPRVHFFVHYPRVGARNS